jgi:hypothetical protein
VDVPDDYDLADPDDSEYLFESWEFEQLVEASQAGSIPAGRELLRRALLVVDAITGRPGAVGFPDDLALKWLSAFLRDAHAAPATSVAQLISPWKAGARPRHRTVEELEHFKAIRRDAYCRVRRIIEAGATITLDAVCDEVATAMTNEGFRNTRGGAIKGPSVKSWYNAGQRSADTDQF